MKVVERHPDDLDATEMATILSFCHKTLVPPPTEYEVAENQLLLRRKIEAAGRGRAAGR